MNPAETAWMLPSTALVLLMTPALAFFYGGLVRPKNALNTMMMSFVSLGFVPGRLVFPLRASDGDEAFGLDVTLHGEEAYVHAAGTESPVYGSSDFEPQPGAVRLQASKEHDELARREPGTGSRSQA